MVISATKNSLSRVVIILSAFVGIEACLVMSGWIFGIDFLTRIFPGGINMKFPTALVFLFTALALYLVFRLIKDNYELAYIFLPGIVLFIFLIMGTVLIAGATGLRTGIESLFINEQGSIYSLGSGLPSMLSTALFILFGTTCLVSLFIFQYRQKVISYLGLVIVAVSLISTIGYLFSLPILYLEIYGWTPISLGSSLCFLLLGCGLIIISKVKVEHEA